MEKITEEKVLIIIGILLIIFLIFSLFFSSLLILKITGVFETKEIKEDCIIEKTFIDYACRDGRKGFTTLEEWSEIHGGCYDYKYYYKCEGISQLVLSKNRKEKGK